MEKETDGPTNCPGSRCSLICLLYKVIIMMLLVEKRAKREIRVKNVKILRLNSVFPQPLFSLSVVSYFYCPVVLLELVSGTVSTRSSSFFSFQRNSLEDFTWTMAQLAMCCIFAVHCTLKYLLKKNYAL